MPSFAVILEHVAPPAPAPIRSMLEASPHRGAVLGTAVVGRCAMGISGRDDDRFSSLAVEGGWGAVVAGAVDNAPELAGPLDLDPSASSAQVILATVRRRGIDGIAGLRGPFSFAVTDGDRLWAARDHLGLRTVYWRREPRRLIVATDARQVLAVAGISPEPDLEVVEAIFFGEYDDETPGALRGVRRLVKGQALFAEDDRARVTRYWHPERLLETAGASQDELGERFDALMTQAAERVLTGADVVSLSGGIDSPTVASYAAPVHLERFGRPLPALSVVYPDLPAVDERPYIEEVAAMLGMPLTTYTESFRVFDGIDDYVPLLNGPMPRYFLAESAEHYRKAGSLGYRSTLTGELVEWIAARKDFFPAHLLLHGRWRALGRHLSAQRARGVQWRWLARQLATGFQTPTIQRWRTLHGPADVPVPPWIDERRFRVVGARHVVPARRRWLDLQVALFRGAGVAEEAQDTLEDVTGVRNRALFGDIDLCEFFVSLPAEVKFPETRRKAFIVRRVRGKVPDSILDRKDKTFFNDAVFRRVDYDTMKRYLIAPPVRLRGIDYEALAGRLEGGDMAINEYEYAKNLTAIHVFLSLW